MSSAPQPEAVSFEDRLFLPIAKSLLLPNLAVPPHHATDAEKLKRFACDEDPEFVDDRLTALLSFGFTPSERSRFTIAATGRYAERVKPGQHHTSPTALVVDRILLTREEFIVCWVEARGFRPAAETVDRVCKLFSRRKAAFMESLTRPSEPCDASAPPLADFELTLLESPDRVVHLATFVRCCTLDRDSIASTPFPLSYARLQRERFKGLVSLIYFIPFIIMFTYFFIDSSTGTTGFFSHKADHDAFNERLFALPCDSQQQCTEQAVQTLNFFGTSNTTAFYQWLSTRVVQELWGSNDAATATKPMHLHVYPVGALRVWQTRVAPVNNEWQTKQYITDVPEISVAEASIIGSIFTLNYTRAYPELLLGTVDKDPYQLVALNASQASNDVVSAFKYTPCPIKNPQSPFVIGQVANYPCGGHALTMPYNRTRADAIAAIQGLDKFNWIDRATRGVFVSRTSFNKDTQVFVTTTSGFEISAGGHWSSLRLVYVYRWFTFQGQSGPWYFFFALYLVFILSYVWNFFHTVRHRIARTANSMGRALLQDCHPDVIILFGQSLFRVIMADMWLLVQFSSYTLFLIVWIWRIILWANPASEPAYKVDAYASSLESYAMSQTLINYLEAVNCLMLYLQLFRSFKHFKVLDAITRTISRSSTDLYGICFTGFVLLIAFSVSGYVAYSAVLPDFATMPTTFRTLLRFLIGDVDFDSWNEARKVISPAYLACLQIFLVVILLDAITAIIADTYADIVEEDFDVSTVQRVAQADTTCLITFDGSTNVLKIFLFEMKAKALTVLRICMRFARRIQSETTTRAQAAHEDSKVDRGLFWKFMKTQLWKVYYGSDEDALEALMDIRELVLIQAGVDASDITLRPEFVLTMLSTDPTAAHATRRTLWGIVEESCGSNMNFYVTLFLYLPHHVADYPLGGLVLDLVEFKKEWLKHMRASNEAKDDGAVRPLRAINASLGAMRGVAKSLAAAVKQREQANASLRERVALGMPPIFDRGGEAPQPAPLEGAAAPRTAEERWLQRLRRIARFRGMPKAEVEKLQDKSKGAFGARLQNYQQAWERQHIGWRGGDPVEGVERVFSSTHNHAVDVAAAEAEMLRMPTSETEWVKRGSLSLNLTTREFIKIRDAFGNYERADNTQRMSLEEFEMEWYHAKGERIPDVRRFAIEEMFQVTGENTVTKEDFVKYGMQFHKNAFNRSFALSFFGTVYGKVLNAAALAAYIPFLAFYSYLLFTNFQPGLSYATTSVRLTVNDVFRSPWLRSFRDISNGPHFAQYLKYRLLESTMSASGGFPTTNFDFHNVLVGGIKVRQVRAMDQKYCGLPDHFTISDPKIAARRWRYFPTSCAPRWAVARQLREDLDIPANLSARAASAFRYDGTAVGGLVTGDIGDYGYAGHILFIPASMTIDAAKSLVDEVFNAGWVDEHTRAINIEFFMYNWDLNAFTRTQKLFEVSAGGAWNPMVRQAAFTIWNSQSVSGFYYFALGVFFLFLLANTVGFINRTVSTVRILKRELSTTTTKAFFRMSMADGWWWLTLVNLTLMFAAWVLRLVIYGSDALSTRTVRIFNPNVFPDNLVWRAEARYALEVMESMNAFFTFSRIFYFVRLHSGLNILTNTLQRASKTMFSVLILSFVIIVAFAIAGKQVYGGSVQSMSSVSKSLSTLVLTFFGNDDFDNWFLAETVFTGIYYALFTVVGVQIMFNMITSVLASAYDEAKDGKFDASGLHRVARVDPTVIGGGSRYLVTFELRYMAMRLLNITNGDRDQQRWIHLCNYRTFFTEMMRNLHLLELGTPSESAVAAVDLLRDLEIIRERAPGQHTALAVVNAWESASARLGHFRVYGEARPRVNELMRSMLNYLPVEDVLFWCVDLPAKALGTPKLDSIRTMLDFNHVWQQDADQYMRPADDSDDDASAEEAENIGATLRQQHSRLSRICTKTLKAVSSIL